MSDLNASEVDCFKDLGMIVENGTASIPAAEAPGGRKFGIFDSMVSIGGIALLLTYGTRRIHDLVPAIEDPVYCHCRLLPPYLRITLWASEVPYAVHIEFLVGFAMVRHPDVGATSPDHHPCLPPDASQEAQAAFSCITHTAGHCCGLGCDFRLLLGYRLAAPPLLRENQRQDSHRHRRRWHRGPLLGLLSIDTEMA